MAASLSRHWRPITAVLLHLLVGGTFIYAGLAKAYDPSAFVADIDHYALLIPRPLTVAIALYLPWLELACGLCLAFNRLIPGALTLVSVLIAAFTVVQLSAWHRGIDATCGCFGPSSAPTSYVWLLTRDLLLIVAIAIYWPQRWSCFAPLELPLNCPCRISQDGKKPCSFSTSVRRAKSPSDADLSRK